MWLRHNCLDGWWQSGLLLASEPYQKGVISAQKQPGFKKKGVALFKIASAKKLQNQRG